MLSVFKPVKWTATNKRTGVPSKRSLLDLLMMLGVSEMEANLCELTRYGYSWKESNQLCAYFAYKVSHKLKLAKAVDSNGKTRSSWIHIERLFGLKRDTLKTAKGNWMKYNSKFEPPGFEQVDTIID